MYLNSFEKLIDNHQPPTLYSLLDSMCYTKGISCKIIDMAKYTHEYVFDFDYPLSEKIDKATFETNIINHFLMRRIGQETYTAFKLMLYNKLNEIMPFYNKLFDSLEGWDLFNDGELMTRTNENKSNTKTSNNSNSTTDSTSDRRYSDMPDNHLDNIQNGTYLTDYNLDKNSAHSTDTSTGDAESTSNDIEQIIRAPGDKISIYREFLNNTNNIYTMIYKDLSSIFYGLYE